MSTIRTASIFGRGGSIPNRRGGSPFSTQRQNFLSAVSSRCWYSGSAGIVKGDVNGHLNGQHSPNSVKTPLEFLIYVPEGVAITEYQLLRLRDQKEAREFRTVTGGVLHVSGGATRDLLPFESKKIAPRTYVVVLPNISTGEYGFLPPGAAVSSHASATLGKIYSFRVLE